MKFWILLGVVLFLVVWGLREKFEPTPSIRAPPYDAEEKRRIFNMALQKEKSPPYTFLGYQDRLIERAKQQNAGEKDRKKLEEIAGGFLTPAIQEFYTSKFKPATTPLTKEDVKTFMASYTGVDKDITEQVLRTYFIEQAGTTTNTDYQKELTKLGQGAGYLVPNKPGGGATTQASAGESTRRTGDRAVSSSAGELPGSAMTSSGSTATPGNTTGGSSTTAFGPTSGGTAGTKFKVWGPVGGGREEGGDGVRPMDSSKSNQYPELLGGLGSGGDKTRIDGVGLAEPSSSWQLGISGMLPDAKGLGATDLSKYLPFSRTPGDMEKIPDPYRVSQTFRTSSYSSKTEPVPFLTDFSAFQK